MTITDPDRRAALLRNKTKRRVNRGTGEIEQRCPRCGVWKPLDDEHWHRHGSTFTGFNPYCAECKKAYQRERAGQNRQYTRDYNRQYYAQHAAQLKRDTTDYNRRNASARNARRQEVRAFGITDEEKRAAGKHRGKTAYTPSGLIVKILGRRGDAWIVRLRAEDAHRDGTRIVLVRELHER